MTYIVTTCAVVIIRFKVNFVSQSNDDYCKGSQNAINQDLEPAATLTTLINFFISLHKFFMCFCLQNDNQFT